MTYPEQPGNQGASWSGQPGWPAQQQPWNQPAAAPTSQFPAPQYQSPQYPSPQYPPAASTGAAPRGGGLTAGAALSFVTVVSMAVAGTVALIAVVAASAVSSTLGSLGSYGSSTRSAASSATGMAVVVVIVALGLAFLLFWGGLQATLGRGIGAAVAGNIVAIVLVVIVAGQSSGYALFLAIVPVLAVIVLASARSALSPTAG